MLRHLTHALLFLPLFATGQTYYYINSISVDPPAPTTDDPVTITLHGDLSSTGAYIVSASAQLVGNSVQIDIVAADPGGFTVLVAHEEVFSLGLLPAGDYTIEMNNTVGVWDMAPEPEHLFTVSGSTAVEELDGPDELMIAMAQGRLSATASDGRALGNLEIIDPSGRTTLSTQSMAASIQVDLKAEAPGVYLLRLPERGLVRKIMWAR